MDLFQKEDLNRLLDFSSDPCVSIFMPAHRVGRENMQDPIRLKNILAQVYAFIANKYVIRPGNKPIYLFL